MDEKKFQILALFDLYGSLLTKRQAEVLSQHYERDLSLSEIGQNLKISRQAVKDSIDNAIKTFNQLDGALNLSFIKSQLIRAQNNKSEAQQIIENLVKIL